MRKPVHWSFWAISILTLIWNLLGALNFLMQMNPAALSKYQGSERALIEGRPVWATIAFGIAVFSGVLGSILLCARKSLSYYFFLGSMGCVLITSIHMIKANAFSSAELLGIVVMPIVVAVFLIWYSRMAIRKGWSA